jgi:hypothetical protein
MPSKSGTRAPGPLLLHTDYARSAVEFGSLFWAWPVLARAPRGDGHPVLVVPGLVTGDATTFVLRTFLGRLGYRTYGWGLGRNIGPTAKAVHGLRARLDRIRARHAVGRAGAAPEGTSRGDQRVPPGRVSDSANPQVRTVTAFEVVRGGIRTLARGNASPGAYRQHVSAACACQAPSA